MKTRKNELSETRIMRIREQGYFDLTDREIQDIAFGNRFAYRLCSTIVAIGIITASIPILFAMLGVAFSSLLLPNHPFDYIYNGLLAKRLSLPKVPTRSPQLKFACGVASIWIATTITLFYYELNLAGYMFGSSLLVVAGLVSTIDYCIPSKIWNAVYKLKTLNQF